MTDVRSLLRNERAQRRINHTQATYTATGTLECNVCHIPLKSDQEVWNKHLKSTQHAMRQERVRLSTSRPPEPAALLGISTTTKKRKADDDRDESRKKTRPVLDIPEPEADDLEEPLDKSETRITMMRPMSKLRSKPTAQATIKLPSHPISPPLPTTNPPIDEDEWAAFERDVATPPPDPTLPSALTAEATITAAPLTAAELATQSREQANPQTKERRDAETEGEKEDAARALEEEFDEMEGLEERVAKLRRMREEIRARREKTVEEQGGGEGGGEQIAADTRARDDKDDDDESDDGDGLYGWDA